MTFLVFVVYLAIMAVGITVLAILFKRDCREAKEKLAEEKKEEDDG